MGPCSEKMLAVHCQNAGETVSFQLVLFSMKALAQAGSLGFSITSTIQATFAAPVDLHYIVSICVAMYYSMLQRLQ